MTSQRKGERKTITAHFLEATAAHTPASLLGSLQHVFLTVESTFRFAHVLFGISLGSLGLVRLRKSWRCEAYGCLTDGAAAGGQEFRGECHASC